MRYENVWQIHDETSLWIRCTGIKWSLEIFKCSQNLAFARFARKIKIGARLFVLAIFYNCSHARILVKVFLIIRNFVSCVLKDFWYRTKMHLFMVLNSYKDKKI